MKKIIVGGVITASFLLGFYGGIKYSTPKDISKKLEKVDEIEYTKHNEKITYNDDVLRNIGNGTLRLFINSDTEKSTGVDDGKRTRCELHRSDAQRIIEITKRADECSTRLNGLQEWVLQHVK